MREISLTWTPAALDAWLANPARFLPGNRMAFAGISDEEDRNALIAYLLSVTT
jgi:cytochrome c